MFTIHIHKNGKWKSVTIVNFLFGSLDLGMLNEVECKELANDFRTAADKLDGNTSVEYVKAQT